MTIVYNNENMSAIPIINTVIKSAEKLIDTASMGFVYNIVRHNNAHAITALFQNLYSGKYINSTIVMMLDPTPPIITAIDGIELPNNEIPRIAEILWMKIAAFNLPFGLLRIDFGRKNLS